MTTTARFQPSDGYLPASARRAGYEANKQLLCVIRAEYAGGVHPGKIRAGWTKASISYGGAEVWVASFEVWIGKLSDTSGGIWSPRAEAADAGTDQPGGGRAPALRRPGLPRGWAAP